MAPAQSYQLHPLCRCRGTSPSGGSEGTAHHPQRGQQGPRLPGGGAVEQSETEGVWFVECHQLRVTDYTPFAAAAARNRGMIATGNHYYLDSLRGAPPPKGAAREPWLPGGGAGRPNGLTEGVLFVEWHQLKVTNYTPFAAVAARNRGMIATGNHYYLDSLRGAPPLEGAARASAPRWGSWQPVRAD